MKNITIKRESGNAIEIDAESKLYGLRIDLLDDKNSPAATYEFAPHKLDGLNQLKYEIQCCRVKFDSIMPTTVYEFYDGQK